MIRKRFLPLRGAKIVAWTVAAVAWMTAAIAGRVTAATTTTQTAAPDASASVTETTTQTTAPALPQNGLVVIRAGSTNSARGVQAVQTQPQQTVVRRVVQTPTIVQTPTRQRSGGS